MKPRNPIDRLPTHDVTNMPPHMGDQNLWHDDNALRDWVSHNGAMHHEEHLAELGRLARFHASLV